MSWTDSHSLIERLAALSADGTLSSRLTLATREHVSTRLPMVPPNKWGVASHQLARFQRTATARAASAILQDLRSQMRVAEDMIAKLGYQMRELQSLKSPTKPKGSVEPIDHRSLHGRNRAQSNGSRPTENSHKSLRADHSSEAISDASPLAPLAKVLNFRSRTVGSRDSR